MKHFLSLCMIVVLVTAAFVPPRTAHAMPVEDFLTEAATTISKGFDFISSKASLLVSDKELMLDPIAWAVAKAAVASMTKSMVNWINSGFNGSPAFVTNLQVYLGNINYSTANTFTNQLATNPAVKSPFQSQVASLLQLNFLKSSAGNGFFLQNPYTLNQVSTNDVGFVNGTTDFSSGGGWNAWFALTTNPANNVYGSYFLAQSELNSRLASAQNSAITQLNWGQGFLSWCGDNSGASISNTNTALQSQSATLDNNLPQISADGTVSAGTNNQTTVTSKAADASAPSPQVSNCLRSDGSVGTVQTPGSVIQSQLNKTLGLSGDSLVTADEFDEIIGALLGQLVNQVIGPSGLAGVSSVSSGGSGYIDQAVSQQNNTAGATANATISSAISDQLAQVTKYQSDWQTIGNEASTANGALGNCLVPPAGAQDAVASTTAAAAAAATRASGAIAALNAVRNQMTAAGNDTTAISQASSDYQTLAASSTIPSAADVADADYQAQDTSVTAASSTPLGSLSLYGQMKFIVNQCALPLGV
jgi:hypothetical protein